MRVHFRISSALLMVFVLLLSTSLPATAGSNYLTSDSSAVFTTIDFVPNIETIGVAVSGIGLPPTAELSYRRSGETLWHSGHPLMRIDDGRLIGSLFNLSPATSYDIKVFDNSSELSGSVGTQPDQPSFTPSAILYVNDNALPGGDGSATAPFQTIQAAVDHAGPGTQVLVADGTYREAVTFPRSGTAGNWIQVKASGNAAILDSADRLSGDIWNPYVSKAHVWFTKIDGPVAYLARDGDRYYQYDDRTGLMQARGHGGVTMNEGWYYEPSTLRLYVRSQDDPANHTWQLPRLNHAFDLAARDWVWIEGFEIRFYGTTTNGCGVCTTNTSHIVIRRNKIHNTQLGIFINWNGSVDQGNDTRIEQNEVYDPQVDRWPWAAVKGSFMEGTGIIIRGHIGAIVRDNNVHNFFNGIYTGSSGALENPELAFDTDIYRNYIHDISDDGLEPEGACINQRFRNNTVDRSFVGLSLAPITQGPTWVLRSTFTNFTGRGIKLDSHSDGIVLIYQNTGWTNASNINGMDLISSIHNIVMHNNIFQSTGYSFAEVPTGSSGNDWNNNNWYTTRGSTGPHFKWENIDYNTISALCATSGLECAGYEIPPGLTNPTGSDFTLLPLSPNIDRGILIPGINDDFAGAAPDVGAFEFAFDPPPTVLSSMRVNSNPTNADNVDFTVTFSELVTGVNTPDFILTTAGITGASVTNVSGSGTTYTVTVHTGSGNGTIRLDVADDDSIKDASDNPLGGAGAGNGNFTSGETYTIQKTENVIPSNIDFGDQLFRTSNPPETVTVTNNQGSSITLGTLQGSSSVGTTWTSSKSFFIENDNCSGATLSAGADCTFDVRFLPWSLGAKSGTITVPSNAPDQPYMLSLSGNSIPGTQLLLNRSFDNYAVSTGLPNLWSKSPGFKIGTDGVDDSWAFHGPYSVKLVGDGDLKILSQMVNKSGIPGDDFSFFVTTHADGIPNDADRWLMQVMFYNGSTIVENRNVKLKTGTYEFKRITQTYTATTNYTHIMFRIHFGKSSGTAWVDLSSLQWAP